MYFPWKFQRKVKGPLVEIRWWKWTPLELEMCIKPNLPVGQCLDPSQTGPHTDHALADLTPGSGVDSTHWSRLHSPAGGDEFARLILKAYKVVTTTESSVDDERRLNRRASP